MNVGQLKKILSKIDNDRMEVVVDKDTMWDGNGTFNTCSIKSSKEECIYQCDGDGFQEFDSKGREKFKYKLVLKGGM